MIVQDERLLLSYKRTTYFETKEGNNYLNRYHLRDVSFADPAHPVVNNAVEPTGACLKGWLMTNGGLVLISTAPKYAQNDQRHWFESSNSVLQASVYGRHSGLPGDRGDCVRRALHEHGRSEWTDL